MLYLDRTLCPLCGGRLSGLVARQLPRSRWVLREGNTLALGGTWVQLEPLSHEGLGHCRTHGLQRVYLTAKDCKRSEVAA